MRVPQDRHFPLASGLLQSMLPKLLGRQDSAPTQAFGPIAGQAFFSRTTRQPGQKEPHALLR